VQLDSEFIREPSIAWDQMNPRLPPRKCPNFTIACRKMRSAKIMF
jgi:hypothetical protein